MASTKPLQVRFLIGISLGTCLVCLLVWLLLPHGSKYLETPPAEFYQFVTEVPIPTDAVELAGTIDRDIAPQETCTYFDDTRLYGSDAKFSSIKQMYIANVKAWSQKSVVFREDMDSVTLVVSDAATIGVFDVTENLSLARLTFDEKTWKEGKAVFPTVFMLAIEHHYGNCKPHPAWKE